MSKPTALQSTYTAEEYLVLVKVLSEKLQEVQLHYYSDETRAKYLIPYLQEVISEVMGSWKDMLLKSWDY